MLHTGSFAGSPPAQSYKRRGGLMNISLSRVLNGCSILSSCHTNVNELPALHRYSSKRNVCNALCMCNDPL